MTLFIKTAALALAAPGLLASAIPANAAAPFQSHATVQTDANTWEHGRHRGWYKHGDDEGYRGGYQGDNGYNDYNRGASYEDPVTQSWRGNDGQYYCRRSNGTTGLVIGAVAGGVLGHEVVSRYGDRTLGAILGAAGGALLGRAVDRGSSRCR